MLKRESVSDSSRYSKCLEEEECVDLLLVHCYVGLFALTLISLGFLFYGGGLWWVTYVNMPYLTGTLVQKVIGDWKQVKDGMNSPLCSGI